LNILWWRVVAAAALAVVALVVFAPEQVFR
jgi:hypothetical protein